MTHLAGWSRGGRSPGRGLRVGASRRWRIHRSPGAADCRFSTALDALIRGNGLRHRFTGAPATLRPAMWFTDVAPDVPTDDPGQQRHRWLDRLIRDVAAAMPAGRGQVVLSRCRQVIPRPRLAGAPAAHLRSRLGCFGKRSDCANQALALCHRGLAPTPRLARRPRFRAVLDAFAARSCRCARSAELAKTRSIAACRSVSVANTLADVLRADRRGLVGVAPGRSSSTGASDLMLDLSPGLGIAVQSRAVIADRSNTCRRHWNRCRERRCNGFITAGIDAIGPVAHDRVAVSRSIRMQFSLSGAWPYRRTRIAVKNSPSLATLVQRGQRVGGYHEPGGTECCQSAGRQI